VDDESNFLRAIEMSPGDLALRLVFADWLEERGDVRAGYIRVQCELESLESGDGRRARFEAEAATLHAANPDLIEQWDRA
jgi:uncharacterized protein (TIGR02996 family)